MTSRPSQKPCARTHCDRLVASTSPFETCTPSCNVLHRFEVETTRIVELTGEGEHADALRDATADLFDAFDELLSLRRKVKAAAAHAGIDNYTWSQLLRGQPA
jgi:hypothetical protein